MKGNTKKQNVKVLFMMLVIVVLIMVSYNNLYNSNDDKSLGEDGTSGEISVKKWESDIDYLADTLKSKHKDLFSRITKSDFDDKINSLKDNLVNLNDDQIKVEIMKIIASIGDMHTNIKYENSEPEYGYPFLLYWFDDGIYVINTVDDYMISLYTKLVEIDGKDVDDVIKELKNVIPHENSAWFKYTVPFYLTYTDVLYGLDVVEEKDKVVLTFEDVSGDRFDISVKSENFGEYRMPVVTDSDLPLYLQNKDQYYWYRYFPSEKIVYLKNNMFINAKGKSFDDFTKEIFDTFDNRDFQKLVIDLRNNIGGISGFYDKFIEEIKNNEYINQDGKIFVLVGRKSYSTSIDTIIKLKNETNAIFVGEKTGENPNHYEDGKSLNLKNSGMIVDYSTEYIQLLDKNGDSFTPDIQVDYTIEDYLNMVDPCLETIFKQY